MRTQQHNHVLAGHKEALGSAAAPLVINQDTITEHTTYKKSHVAQIGLHRSKHYAKDGEQAKVVTRLGVNKGWSKVKTWHKRNID